MSPLEAALKLVKSLKRPVAKDRPLETLTDKLRQSTVLVVVE